MTEALTTIASALSQVFEEKMAREWNRLCVGLTLLPVKAGVGKNVAWDVEFSGATAAAVAEGSDVQDAEYTGDVFVPATLAWGEYRSAFRLTELEINVAASSIGTPSAIVDLFGERILGCTTKLASLFNADLYSGNGANGGGGSVPNIVGLSTAIAATGSYAGIYRTGGTNYTEWMGNVLANSGTPRALTVDLLETADQNIYTASGASFDWLLCSPGVYRKYASLFVPATRIVSDGRGVAPHGFGAAEYFFKGKPVYRDKDCTSGTLIMGNSNPDSIALHYVPVAGAPMDVVSRSAMADGQNGPGSAQSPTQIPLRIIPIAKTGTSVKMAVYTQLQLAVKHPNQFAIISDISES